MTSQKFAHQLILRCLLPNIFTDPEWASYSIGIFVCTRCAGIHRGLGVQVSKIKHLKLDKWEETHVRRMAEMGNLKVQSKYEEYVPTFYRKPKEFDPQ